MSSIEIVVSVACALVVGAALALRLNLLRASRAHLTHWQVLEVAGAALGLGGCAGVAGEWFLEGADIHAETILLLGLAAWVVGFTRGHLCQLGVRLQGWDGKERRAPPR